MTLTMVLSEGHGKHTAGKRSPNGEREWYFNNLMGQGFREEAEKYDVNIVLVSDPTGNRDVPLKERTDIANQIGADLYVSLHHNAFRGAWGTHTGTETYTYTTRNPKSVALAREVHNGVVAVYKLYDRGLKSANFFEVRETKMPSCLVEGGYMDSSIDIKVMRDNSKVKEAGRQAFRNIAKAHNIRLKTTASKPAPVPDTSTLYRVQVGAFSRTDYAVKFAMEIEKKTGFDTYMVGVDNLIKVQVGAFSKKPGAEARAEALQAKGYQTFITTKGGVAIPEAEPYNEPEQRPAPPKPPAPTKKAVKAGDRVVLSSKASKYATGENIPTRIKGKTYTVQQVNGNRVLLKEILSWVNLADIGGSEATAPKATPIKTGDRVKIKSSASKYATGQNIPARIKGKTYTVQQVKSDQVLLKEIMSWVYEKDVAK